MKKLAKMPEQSAPILRNSRNRSGAIMPAWTNMTDGGQGAFTYDETFYPYKDDWEQWCQGQRSQCREQYDKSRQARGQRGKNARYMLNWGCNDRRDKCVQDASKVWSHTPPPRDEQELKRIAKEHKAAQQREAQESAERRRREEERERAVKERDRASWNDRSKEVCGQTGTVKWYSDRKGYGFIEPDDKGKDIFFNWQAMENHNGSISEGEKVEFCRIPYWKGPRAEDVVTI